MKVPFIDRLETVNVQVKSLSLEAQQVMSKESVSLKIVAVVFYKVSDAVKAIVEIEDFREAVDQYGQAIMRKQIGQHTLEETLHTKKTEIANQIKSELDETVSDWGIEITKIELKDIGLPQDMARSMASKAEAEREAEAKVIAATGEYESAEKMAEAAKKLESEPGAMQLRWMQTLREVATEGNTIVVTQQGSDGGIVAGAAAGAAAGSGGGTTPPPPPAVAET
jgi:regulator of protease activity HflC (stomatin/prohibitin superfamily)